MSIVDISNWMFFMKQKKTRKIISGSQSLPVYQATTMPFTIREYTEMNYQRIV